MAVPKTTYPFAASPRAISRPRPPPAPVTTAARPECSDVGAMTRPLFELFRLGVPTRGSIADLWLWGIVPADDALVSPTGYLCREKWNTHPGIGRPADIR